jgi:chromosome segregation ATPase
MRRCVGLQRQLKEERTRAATAESELSREKELHHNSRLHKDSIIDNLKGQVENLNKLLEDAEAKIPDLESKLSTKGELAS